MTLVIVEVDGATKLGLIPWIGLCPMTNWPMALDDDIALRGVLGYCDGGAAGQEIAFWIARNDA